MKVKYQGLTLVGAAHMEHAVVLTVPPDAPLVIRMTLKATNIGDGTLPSTILVGIPVLSVDITAHRPYTEGPDYGNPFQDHEVPDDLEENPGAGIRINGDTEAAANENDLIEVELEVAPFPVPSGVQYFLRRNNSNIRVWDNRQGTGTALLDSGTEAAFTVTASPMSVWVENPSGGNADFELVAKDSGGNDVCSDKIHFYPFESIAIGLSGEVWPGGDPLANGMFDVAEDLHEQGYDAHYYDEDVVGNNGAGAAYDEVVSAIQDRGVTHVAIYGHSHGGGSTHDLAERLNANRAGIGTFTINVTVYVDAIQNDSDFDTDSELAFPPSSGHHMNYYQPNGLLHGGIVPGADNLDVTTTQWGQNLDHGTIDNNGTVINAVRDRIIQQMSQP